MRYYIKDLRTGKLVADYGNWEQADAACADLADKDGPHFIVITNHSVN